MQIHSPLNACLWCIFILKHRILSIIQMFLSVFSPWIKYLLLVALLNIEKMFCVTVNNTYIYYLDFFYYYFIFNCFQGPFHMVPSVLKLTFADCFTVWTCSLDPSLKIKYTACSNRATGEHIQQICHVIFTSSSYSPCCKLFAGNLCMGKLEMNFKYPQHAFGAWSIAVHSVNYWG